jgi:putative endopeptidase
MGMPGREFYLNDDDKTKEIRGKYRQYVAHLLQLSGERDNQASADAQAVLAIETGLAKASMDIVSRRDPKLQNHKLTLDQVQALTPSFDWRHYLTAMHPPTSPHYLVFSPEFFRGVENLLASHPIQDWRAYLRYSVLRFMSPFLSDTFSDATFDFYGRTLAGAKVNQPRWRRCSSGADTDLGDAVGQAYVSKYFPPENKQRMLEMVKALEHAFSQSIQDASWMSPQTKEAAQAKLAAQLDKIGYPDHWSDYSSLEIKREDYLGNIARSSLYEMNRRMARFNQPTQRNEWIMTPPTVNAYEDPPTNTVNFPAGILQPPFFDASQIDAVNYGGIGTGIGHEITHGFDDQGRKYDAQGNLRDWWTADDASNYDQRDKCIVDEYTQDVPEGGVKQDGRLSAGEDTADNGGIRIAMLALENTLKSQGKELDSPAGNGLSELQSFFLSYANIWCGEVRPEGIPTYVTTQPHSLYRFRVNNVLGNLPEFAHAFGCKAGQPMVHVNACRVW